MVLLIGFVVFTACMVGLGYLAAMWRYRRQALLAEERLAAARGDAQGLSEALQGLQAALAAGLPVDGEFDPGMPRTEAIFLEALERDLKRPLPLRVRRSIRRAERAASQT
ncbi:hypothetical protein [Glycomyces sp. NPDC021274]|uniref:hypothetical protein n=1 Tax=Glycomyces sp. NPDC021274 TaxID=3155120 RepID=UPI0034065A86